MPVETYNADFWRWLLKREYDDFQHIYENQTVISNAENIIHGGFDLEINLVEGRCHDSKGHNIALAEYVACKNNATLQETEIRLEVEFERWKDQWKAEQDSLEYFRDYETYRWFRRKGSDNIVVTEFDILLDSIIEKWNSETQDWDRSYEGRIRYFKFKEAIYKPFLFEPGQTHSVEEFSKAVWEKDVLEVKNMRNEEMRSFWSHVNHYYKPRIVREYDHYGFITFEKEKYFLAGNVLINFPKKTGQQLQLIALQDGAFPVGDNKFIKPPDDAVHLPHFELGVADPSGYYKKAMRMLFDDERFEEKFKEVEHHFCKMVGGDSEFDQWGKLILSYIFSYIYFDEIYGHFKHIIFLYLYGEGNVGKGEVAKRILDFFGINYLDSLNTPPPRSVDEALEMKSQIPQWIDEHVPQVPGKQAKIEDQTWNSWFELKPRPTNIKKGNKWGKERKEVRTMPLFCSNFKPATDHLLSRSLIYEYKKSIRGPEQHVKWLMQNKEILQLLMISYMQNYYLVDRKLFVWDLDRMRSFLRDTVKQDIAQRDSNAVLQDRQISQFASLLTVYHWLKPEYRREISNVELEFRELEKSEDESFKTLIQENLHDRIDGLIDKKLFGFIRKEIVRNAVIAARHDPLSDYIDSIGTLIQAQKITTVHFNWMEDGRLKFWAKAVWDIYEQEKRGTDSLVRKDIVDEKLKDLSDLGKNGDLKVVNWAISESASGIALGYTRQRGYSIPKAVEIEIFRNAFNWDKFRPGGSSDWATYKMKYGIEEEGDDLQPKNTESLDEESAPF
jgi:hypothetical protein